MVHHPISFFELGNSMAPNWKECKQMAKALGGRLPKKSELNELLKDGPLWTEDMWIPVEDEHNGWVSCGNFDTAHRLGKLHSECCGGLPGWGEDNSVQTYRRFIAVHGHFHVFWRPTTGTLSHEQSIGYAKNHGGELPTVEEIRGEVFHNRGRPLFDQDMWVPASDSGNCWVSVGNFDPHKRLGHPHTVLGCEPGWGNTSEHLAYRQMIAIRKGN